MKNKFLHDKHEIQHTRREFLKKTAGLTTGLLFSPFLNSHTLKAGAFLLDKSKVVIVKDDNSLDQSVVNENVVQIMVDAGIIELTGINDVGSAWKSLFPDITINSTIGIKVNCINQSLSSHPEVAFAIVEGLKRIKINNEFFPENNIIIWDRYNKELRNAGYMINTENTGVRCFGTNQRGVGYSNKLYNVSGSSQKLSRIVTKSINYLINLSVLKNHGTAGVTLSMKNHYGTCNQPGTLHGSYCNPYIPALNTLAPIKDKQVLCINDALMGIVSGGPGGPPQIFPKSLILSTDPVALDTIGSQMLGESGCKTLNRAKYIHSAASQYYLGTDDTDQIDLKTITSPSIPGLVILDTTSIQQGENINVSWSDWPGNVDIAIYKDNALWRYVAMDRSSSGSEELDTSGWEIRNDYKIKIILCFNDGISQFSDTFSVEEPATSIEEKTDSEIPDQFHLYQNYPNPFNPRTVISYQLKSSADVKLDIYNLRGTVVKGLIHQKQNAGVYRVQWNGKNQAGISVPSGTYIARLKVDSYSRSIKMQLLR